MDPTTEMALTNPTTIKRPSPTEAQDEIDLDAIVLRNDLRLYIRSAWHVVEPSTVYLENWHDLQSFRSDKNCAITMRSVCAHRILGASTIDPLLVHKEHKPMAYNMYKLIKVEVRGKIVYATIDSPPVNLITLDLLNELTRLSTQLEADDDLLVFVLRSANPDFFIAHFDVGAILEFPVDKPARHEDYANAFYHDMCERFRLMNKITIAQIEGRVGGGGSELSMSFDMR